MRAAIDPRCGDDPEDLAVGAGCSGFCRLDAATWIRQEASDTRTRSVFPKPPAD